MKQRITPEQIAELTDEQKERLREWWSPEPSDHFTNGNAEVFYVGSIERSPGKFITYGDDIPHGKDGLLPILSIGQMIELLHDKGTFYQITADAVEDDMVCHVLWRAVKSVL